MRYRSLTDVSARRARSLAFLLSVVLMTPLLVVPVGPAAQQMLTPGVHPAWIFAAVIALVAGASVVLTFFYVLCLALFVTLLRGSHHTLAWCSWNDCTSFSNWLSQDWCFFGSGGMQQGTRFLGFEVALQGHLR